MINNQPASSFDEISQREVETTEAEALNVDEQSEDMVQIQNKILFIE